MQLYDTLFLLCLFVYFEKTAHAFLSRRFTKITHHLSDSDNFNIRNAFRGRRAQNDDQLVFPQIDFFWKEQGVFLFKDAKEFLTIEDSQVITKPCNDNQQQLLFDLYFYKVPEAYESILVLPVHNATGTVMSMTLDRKIITKHSNDVDSKSVHEDFTKLNNADDRFFYYKTSGTGESYDVMEAMNGKLEDYNYLLSATSGQPVTLQKSGANGAAPTSAMFDFIHLPHLDQICEPIKQTILIE